MNLLIISNADSCRSRIAQALLSSFGKGMKVYSAGTMPAAEIHPLVLKLIKETDIEPNTQPPHSIREYTNENWDHIIVLSGTADDIRNLFRKEVKHWYHVGSPDTPERRYTKKNVRTIPGRSERAITTAL